MTYNIQCIRCSYVGSASAGSELEERCRQRAADGKLDALILSPEECPQCCEDRIERCRREVRMCGDIGCPMDVQRHCADGCMAANELRAAEAAAELARENRNRPYRKDEYVTITPDPQI